MIWAKATGSAIASGTPGALLGALFLCEAGVPVPIPADLLMIVLGERVSAGAIPLPLAVGALQVVAVVGTLVLYGFARGPGRTFLDRFGSRIGLTEPRIQRVERLVERRGVVALGLGRSTPGLRTVTVVAAAGSPMRLRTLVALFVGSTVFVQGHFLLGLALGPSARAVAERAGSVVLGVVLALVVLGLVVWIARRPRREGLQSFTEACCPACLALAAVTERGAGAR